MKRKIPYIVLMIMLLIAEIPILFFYMTNSDYWNSQKEHAYSMGILEGMSQSATAISKEFGTTDQQSSTTVFNIKERSIIALTVNNIKTIREYRSKPIK